MSKATLTKQLDTLQVLPKPERFTELYFTEHSQLPSAIRTGVPQKIMFTTHNVEHQPTTYRYDVSIIGGAGEQQVDSGAFTLNHGETATTIRSLLIPPLDRRVTIQVTLEYEGIGFGDTSPRTQMQSIHYTVDVIGFTAGTL